MGIGGGGRRRELAGLLLILLLILLLVLLIKLLLILLIIRRWSPLKTGLLTRELSGGRLKPTLAGLLSRKLTGGRKFSLSWKLSLLAGELRGGGKLACLRRSAYRFSAESCTFRFMIWITAIVQTLRKAHTSARTSALNQSLIRRTFPVFGNRNFSMPEETAAFILVIR